MSNELKPPIILFGNFRSGTTMLQKVIATHPDVVPLYEPVGIWLYADPGRDNDEFDEGDATKRVKKYIRRWFLKYQRENGNRTIIEKTPHNILRIPYVRAIFPEARFIYIVRNPLSFVSSVEIKWQRPVGMKRIKARLRKTPATQWHRYFGRLLKQQWISRVLKRKYLPIWGPRYRGIQQDLKESDLLTVIARQWARASAKAERDLAEFEPGQVLRLRYEDFVDDPLSGLQRICDHCGLEMTTDLARQVQDMVKTDRKHKWQRFEPGELARIIPELMREMQRVGYSIPAEFNGAREVA
ncbi:MAG TPA: sulfotransferase [Sphingomicrobium sp.]|nr:sulfotransferase [Sphingomicrobium sp.]